MAPAQTQPWIILYYTEGMGIGLNPDPEPRMCRSTWCRTCGGPSLPRSASKTRRRKRRVGAMESS